MSYHNPVLLSQSVDSLEIRDNGIYVDMTYGGGGHSREILKKLGSKGKLIAFDQDLDSQRNIIDDERLFFFRQNNIFLMQTLEYLNVKKVDGILADLGVSSHQLDKKSRGFSFHPGHRLDMRMNQKQNIDHVKPYKKKFLRTTALPLDSLSSLSYIGYCVVATRQSRGISCHRAVARGQSAVTASTPIPSGPSERPTRQCPTLHAASTDTTDS